MEKTWLWLILGLLIGSVVMSTGYSLFSPVKVVYQDVEVEVPVPGPETIVEVPTETIVADATLFLDEATAAVFDEIGDDDDFLTCGGHEFDEDEVSVARVKEWTYTWLDDDEYEVSFEAKFEFEDASDERDCKETRDYTVLFEEREDPVIQ